MPTKNPFDAQHDKNLLRYVRQIDQIFKAATKEAAAIGVLLNGVDDDKIFRFKDFPATRKRVEKLLNDLKDNLTTVVVNGVRSEWTLANNKNNELCRQVFGDNIGKLSKEQYERYFSTNELARDAFLDRAKSGLNLSSDVWNIDSFKKEIELGLDVGIRAGRSASEMASDLQMYLKHPDKLFRRVKDEHGQLQLSKAAADYHPGRGVYRSSYKNALRLAGTETNIAYRTADHLRWQKMDFVVGILIEPSKTNHKPDICDELGGKYPKEFKFVGWHPQCRCHAVPILKTLEEMAEDNRRILNGEDPTEGSENAVKHLPGDFTNWIEHNKKRIEDAKSLPYFIKDNRELINRPIKLNATQKAELRHSARSEEDKQRIKAAWNKRNAANDKERTQLREQIQANIKLRESAGVITSILEKQMLTTNLNKLREVAERCRDEMSWLREKAKINTPSAVAPIKRLPDAEADKLFKKFLDKHGIPIQEVSYQIKEGAVCLGKGAHERIVDSYQMCSDKDWGIVFSGKRLIGERTGHGYLGTTNYRVINGCLRDIIGNGKFATTTRKLDLAKLKMARSTDKLNKVKGVMSYDIETIQTLDRLIDNGKLPFPIRVVRNMDFEGVNALFGGNLSVKKDIIKQLSARRNTLLSKDSGFMSTSSNAAENVFDRDFQLRITIPKNHKLFFSNHYKESEVVLERLAQLKLRNITKSGGKYIMDCDLI